MTAPSVNTPAASLAFSSVSCPAPVMASLTPVSVSLTPSSVSLAAPPRRPLSPSIQEDGSAASARATWRSASLYPDAQGKPCHIRPYKLAQQRRLSQALCSGVLTLQHCSYLSTRCADLYFCTYALRHYAVVLFRDGNSDKSHGH